MMDSIELRRDCEAISIPRGARQTLPKGTAVRIVQERSGSYTISTMNRAMYRIDANDADAMGLESTSLGSDPGRTGAFSEELVWITLKTVYDPELPVNVVDLGLIYDCTIAPKGDGTHAVSVRMAMTSPGCGMSEVLKSDVQNKLSSLPGVSEAHVEVVFDPPWNPSRMSEAARLQVGTDLRDRQTIVQISRSR
jgi:probable FeS assembly SUF system protein SufT